MPILAQGITLPSHRDTPSPILVDVGDYGALLFEEHPHTQHSLIQALQKRTSNNKHQPITLRTSPNLSYQQVASLMTALTHAGMNNLVLQIDHKEPSP